MARLDTLFVIQGKEFRVNVDSGDLVKDDIRKALEESGNAGDVDGWTARTESGEILDGSKTLPGQGVAEPTKIFLNKGPGRGG